MIDHPHLLVTTNAATDFRSGLVDPRLTAILDLLLQDHQISVRTVKTGHPMGPASPAGRRNDHFFYCAIDANRIHADHLHIGVG